MNNCKDVVLITARLKSTRLPRKALIEVNGLPLILHQIKRITANVAIDCIVCTSTNKQDDALEDLCVSIGQKFFRGSEEDVLERYLECAKSVNAENIYITYADEPFIDIELLQKTFSIMREHSCVWVKNDSYPDGVFGYGLTRKALEKINELKDTTKTEVWGSMVSTMPIDIVANVPRVSVDKKSVRLSVDYPEDLQVCKILMSRLVKNYLTADLALIINTYNALELQKINGFRSDDYNARISIQSAERGLGTS